MTPMTPLPPMALVAAGAERFLAAEVLPLGLAINDHAGSKEAGVAIAGTGTTAAKALAGALLAEALGALDHHVARATAHGSPVELMADPSWQLGIVLSPWKRDVGAHCDRLAPSAERTGVIDTILRTTAGTVGFNTNTWAALSALECLLGGSDPASVLLLGSGASARSVALAVQRAWPNCRLAVRARSAAGAEALAQQFPGLVANGTLMSSTDAQGRGPDVVVNTTTWGETEASEAGPFGIDLDGVLKPGSRLFDLNNRVGALPVQALQTGCAVLSGAVMQRVTNASRASLVAYAVTSLA